MSPTKCTLRLLGQICIKSGLNRADALRLFETTRGRIPTASDLRVFALARDSVAELTKVYDYECKKEKRPALITYTVAGDNNINNSIKILNKISNYADILELGFPHNTPIADGGQIQSSTHRALRNGIKLKNVLNIMKV